MKVFVQFLYEIIYYYYYKNFKADSVRHYFFVNHLYHKVSTLWNMFMYMLKLKNDIIFIKNLEFLLTKKELS